VRDLCGEPVTPVSGLGELSTEAAYDAVINLAGESIAAKRWTEGRRKLLWDSRVALTAELVDFIAKSELKPGVLVSGSAVGFYGNRGDTPLDEESAFSDDFGHRLCAAWEEAARRAAEHGVRVCVLRTGLVIGRNGGFLQRMLPLFKLGLGGHVGDGRQFMSWVHLEDHVTMTEYLLGHTHLEGVFNATAPNPVTNREFTRCLARTLNRPAFLPVPARVLQLALGEMAELLLGGQRVLPARFQKEPFSFRYEHLEEALRDALGV
jgi:uncharacterized protein (TIGR01777 family)